MLVSLSHTQYNTKSGVNTFLCRFSMHTPKLPTPVYTCAFVCECACACVYICMCVHIYTLHLQNIHVPTRTDTHKFTPTQMPVCVRVCVTECEYVSAHAHACLRARLCVLSIYLSYFTRTHTHTHAFTHINTHTHTHTQTHTLFVSQTREGGEFFATIQAQYFHVLVVYAFQRQSMFLCVSVFVSSDLVAYQGR